VRVVAAQNDDGTTSSGGGDSDLAFVAKGLVLSFAGGERPGLRNGAVEQWCCCLPAVHA
jgi:hypothetical protein